MTARFAMAAAIGLMAAACRDPIPPDLTIGDLAFTPDGTVVVSTNDGIFLFDAQLEAEKGRVALDRVPAFGPPYDYAYSLSADGTVAAVAYGSDSSSTPIAVELYRVPTGQTLRFSQVIRGDRTFAMAISPHGDRVAAIALDGNDTNLSVIDAATGAVTWTAATNGAELAPVWSPDGATLYVVMRTTMGSVVEAFDTGGGVKWSQRFPYGVLRLAVTDGGATLAGVTSVSPCADPCTGQYSWWSAVDGATLAQQDFPPKSGWYSGPFGKVGNGAFACASSGDVCAIQNADNSGPTSEYTVRIYRSDGTEISTLPPMGTVSSLALSSDGQLVAAGGGGIVDVYRTADGMRVGDHSFYTRP